MLHGRRSAGVGQLRREVHAETLGQRLVRRVGDHVVDGVPVAPRGALAQRERHRRFRGRWVFLKAGRSLHILGGEEAVRAKGLVKRVCCVEAHERELGRESCLRTRHAAHSKCKCKGGACNASRGEVGSAVHTLMSPG